MGTPMSKHFCVYIMTNPGHTVLYTGVTSNLLRRVYEHKTKAVEGFTRKYNVTELVTSRYVMMLLPQSLGKSRSKEGLARRRSL